MEMVQSSIVDTSPYESKGEEWECPSTLVFPSTFQPTKPARQPVWSQGLDLCTVAGPSTSVHLPYLPDPPSIDSLYPVPKNMEAAGPSPLCAQPRAEGLRTPDKSQKCICHLFPSELCSNTDVPRVSLSN